MTIGGRNDNRGPQCQSGAAMTPQPTPGQRLYFVAFVERGESRRIISLRKANEREVQTYVENS